MTGPIPKNIHIRGAHVDGLVDGVNGFFEILASIVEARGEDAVVTEEDIKEAIRISGINYRIDITPLKSV